MEQLLHYCWKHRMYPLRPLVTTDGREVEIIDPGLHNRNSGPDFFNAKVRIGGTLWVGNVEIHDRSTDWFAHGHQTDEAYNNVVLHVAEVVDGEVTTQDGQQPPQLQLEVPAEVRQHYAELLQTDSYPPCYRIIPSLNRLTVHAWMSSLQVERLEQKTQAIMARVAKANGSWEDAFFQTMARNFGFGVNGDAFEAWARQLPLNAVAHHRDDLFQVEAVFMGQAGLLNPDIMQERARQAALADGYFNRLRNEYQYLAHKFGMQSMEGKMWRFLRLRPQNFPYIRLAQLAMLYHDRHASLSQVVECATVAELEMALQTSVSPYWQTHYTFGTESKHNEKRLSRPSLHLIILNTVVPVLFAYGRHQGKEQLCDRAFDLMDQLKAEDNHIVRMWQQCGLNVTTAGDSQALIQLKREYCDRRECLRCRFGFEYLKGIRNEESSVRK